LVVVVILSGTVEGSNSTSSSAVVEADHSVVVVDSQAASHLDKPVILDERCFGLGSSC
jgi:hypothetical protein